MPPEGTHQPNAHLWPVPDLPDQGADALPAPEMRVGPRIPVGSERDEPRWGRVLRRLGKVALLVPAGLGIGIMGSMVVPAHTHIGPHSAEVRLTLDGALTPDFGPLGYMSKPIEGSGIAESLVEASGIGMHVDVKEMPGEKNPADAAQASFSENDAKAYANFASDTKKDKATVEKDLLEHILKLGLAGDAALLGLYGLLGSRRRKELYENMSSLKYRLPESRMIRAGLATIALAAPFGALGTHSAAQHHDKPNVGHAFDNTPLEGWTIYGKWLQILVNKYGADFITAWQEDQRFYDEAIVNMEHAFKKTEILKPEKGAKLALVEVGSHCNIGMDRLMGRARSLWDTSIFMTGGDDTIAGTAPEDICVSTLAFHADGVTKIGAEGNHGSTTTIEQKEMHGVTMLKGQVLGKAGIQTIGDTSPRESIPGQGISYRRNETESQMGRRLGETAKKALRTEKDKAKGIVGLVNEPNAAWQLAASGGVTLAIAGKLGETEVSQVRARNGKLVPLMLVGSAGGQSPDQLTIGVLKNPAHFALVELDANSNPLRYQPVTINTDKTVYIGEISYFVNAPLAIEKP